MTGRENLAARLLIRPGGEKLSHQDRVRHRAGNSAVSSSLPARRRRSPFGAAGGRARRWRRGRAKRGHTATVTCPEG